MNSFALLNRDMQKYIYENGWKSLSKIQDAAIKHMYGSENNLILAAPTASGKTEAAFLPAISRSTDIKEKLKILYISPLIALINDQYKRVFDMCKDLDISVISWHSEASKAKKDKLIENPRGILLITPESLEAMLINNKDKAEKLFYDLDYIIIDEIHGFLNTNRGLQLKSLLVRIQEYCKNPPRMIGLSASIGDMNYDLAKNFFINDRPTNILLDRSKNDLEKTIDYIPSDDINKEIVEKIIEYTTNSSSLVFPNSRMKVEKLAYMLKKEIEDRNLATRVFSHHSSISKIQRQAIEEFAKEGRENFIIVATSTLELGIDIGSVDRVIQVGSVASVLSLAQRLGRSGRKVRKSIIHQISTNPWDLLQALGALSLYEKGILDKIDPVFKAYDIFAHQVLSNLLEKNGLKIEDYYKEKNQAFDDIDDEEFKILTDFMVKKNFIEEIDGEYILGLEAEKLMTMGSFYNQFISKSTYRVYFEKQLLGEIELGEYLDISDRIYLSGSPWEIDSINHKQKKISVKKAEDTNSKSFYSSGSFEISGQIRVEMENILINLDNYNFDENINKTLKPLAEEIRGEDFHFVEVEDKEGLRTFKSSKINRTLALYLNIRSGRTSYYVDDIKTTILGPSIKKDLKNLIKNPILEDEIIDFFVKNPRYMDNLLSANKFMNLVPDLLKIKYIRENVLDQEGTEDYLSLQNL